MHPRNEPRTWILVAIVAAVSLMVASICFVPVIDCPSCASRRHYGVPLLMTPACGRCNDRARISVLNRWLKGAPEFPAVPSGKQ